MRSPLADAERMALILYFGCSGIPQPGTGKNIRSEFGAYLNMKFKKDIMEMSPLYQVGVVSTIHG